MEMSKRRVMVIGAHPDDADILTGLMTRRASHADFGDDVVHVMHGIIRVKSPVQTKLNVATTLHMMLKKHIIP